MVIKDFINNRDDFNDLCKSHHVKQIYAFGSSVSGDFNSEKSDIDLLVEIDEPDPLERGEIILSLWDKLETFFKRKVDLIANPNIRNPYLKQSIENSKVLIYDASK
ncbi:MAG: nucleotidyltransferase family protein [Bacteroidota bacterium]